MQHKLSCAPTCFCEENLTSSNNLTIATFHAVLVLMNDQQERRVVSLDINTTVTYLQFYSQVGFLVVVG